MEEMTGFFIGIILGITFQILFITVEIKEDYKSEELEGKNNKITQQQTYINELETKIKEKDIIIQDKEETMHMYEVYKK